MRIKLEEPRYERLLRLVQEVRKAGLRGRLTPEYLKSIMQSKHIHLAEWYIRGSQIKLMLDMSREDNECANRLDELFREYEDERYKRKTSAKEKSIVLDDNKREEQQEKDAQLMLDFGAPMPPSALQDFTIRQLTMAGYHVSLSF